MSVTGFPLGEVADRTKARGYYGTGNLTQITKIGTTIQRSPPTRRVGLGKITALETFHAAGRNEFLPSEWWLSLCGKAPIKAAPLAAFGP